MDQATFQMLEWLKIDLGITTKAYDERLISMIAQAREEIQREGATLNVDCLYGDSNLVIMYAAWLWRKRATGEGMPRMLRYALNNRILSEKAGANT